MVGSTWVVKCIRCGDSVNVTESKDGTLKSVHTCRK